MKVKKIIVSQQQPADLEKSPYHDLAERFRVKIDFRPFIKVEGVGVKEFRQYHIDILSHTAVIFTCRTAIDHFFRICEELRITVPDTMKYFCLSESIAFYLQKYIVYRKRKIFSSKTNFDELIAIIHKHPDEKILLPLSEPHKLEIPKALEKQKIKFTKGIFYRTVASDLSDIDINDYDMMVLYSPAEVKSLFQNFPEFVQGEKKIAAFGPTTANALKDQHLNVDVAAPLPKVPSMTMALELFLKENAKETRKQSNP